MHHLTKSLVFFFVVIALSTFAQDRSVIYLNQQNGLPSNYVYDIFQDKKGFLWMATDAGLYRYDGFEYKLYVSGKQSSLAGSCIQEDGYGRIWYENFDGYLFYIENGKLNQIHQNNPIQFLPFGLNDKHLYVIHKNGVNIYDLKTLKVVKTIDIEFVYAENAALIDGHFFITDQDKVVSIDPQFNVYQTSVKLHKKMGVKLVKRLNGEIAVIARSGKTINFYDEKLNFRNQVALNLKGLFHDVYSIKDNVYGIITSKGIEYARITDKKVVLFGSDYLDLNVSKYLSDKNGNTWLATLGEGVRLLLKISNQNVYHNSKKYRLFSKKDDAFVGVADNGKVELFGPELNIKQLIFETGSDVDYLYMPEKPNSFMYTDNRGLHLYSSGRVRNYNVALKEAVKLDDKYYLVAVSGFYGLFKNPFAALGLSSDWDRFFSQNVFNLEEFSAFRSHIRAKSIDYSFLTKQIVVATNVGTFVNSRGAEQEIKYKGHPFYVRKIFWDQHMLFALTTNGDFYKITQLNKFEKIDLPEKGIRLMKRQGESVFLVGTNLIYAYNLKTGVVAKYDIDFNNNTIRDFSVDGDFLIVAGENGITKIKYKAIKVNAKVPFYINGVYVNEQEIASLEDLSFTQNNIRINYSLLNYGKKNGFVIFLPHK